MASFRDLRAPTRRCASLSPQKRERNYRAPCPVVTNAAAGSARGAWLGTVRGRVLTTKHDWRRSCSAERNCEVRATVSMRSHFEDFEIRPQGKSIVSWQEGVNDRGAYSLSSRGQSLAEDHARLGPHLADDRDDRTYGDRAPVLSHPRLSFAAPFRLATPYLQLMQLRDSRVPAWSHT